jgi:hypothetical protein
MLWFWFGFTSLSKDQSIGGFERARWCVTVKEGAQGDDASDIIARESDTSLHSPIFANSTGVKPFGGPNFTMFHNNMPNNAQAGRGLQSAIAAR